MKAIVTGAEGFIGQHLCSRLKAGGHDVLPIDIKSGRDIRDCELPPADVVYHLAAQTDAANALVAFDADINIMGTLRLLQTYGSRLIFASSSMVNYPVSPYAISKRAGEDYCGLYGASIVRLCNIHGPGGHSVIDVFEASETLTIRGDGTQLRSYAHVDQAVDMFIEEGNDRKGRRLLIGEMMTVNDIAGRFPNKRRVHVDRADYDLVHAPQCMVGWR